MPADRPPDPDLDWLLYAPPVGLVVAPAVLQRLGLTPLPQTAADTGAVVDLLEADRRPVPFDPWAFVSSILGWEPRHVAGAPGGPPVPEHLSLHLPEHGVTLSPTWAVAELGEGAGWQLLVRIEDLGVEPEARGALDGWEATPLQRFERLLRESGVHAGLLITQRLIDERTEPELRLVYAPSGETSGHQAFPIRAMATVAGRPILAGLKLLLDRDRLFTDATDRRLPALLAESRRAQDQVSVALSGQVLGALYELLRGFTAAEHDLTSRLAQEQPDHLYEGLLTVLMRLVFILYAEDRDLLPSRTDAAARALYERGYSVRSLFARLTEDAAHNPDTMDQRRGAWGALLALFRLIHGGHRTGFVRARGGALFDPQRFGFLERKAGPADPPRVLPISDGCILRILEGLLTLKAHGGVRERLSYRSLDVEQIGSVYETVMGFRAEVARGRALAVKDPKGLPVFVDLDELAARAGKARLKALKDVWGLRLATRIESAIQAADSAEALAAAFGRAVDERASPAGPAAPGTPILQPTSERRRSGSHYTPRSLTAPIVEHALAPAFERLGPDATPEQILSLKVCDPAMGSGAFLVEACRALAARLVKAWERWPNKRPPIPPDEDEALHARRLVALNCLYGVDRNPRAVELAKLSLWLATLARDHEFTFLDHALKCGDSLVGLDLEQIAAAHWDRSQAPTLVGRIVRQHLAEAEAGRAEIRRLAEGAGEAELAPRLRGAEAKLNVGRLVGDGVIAAFFSEDKPRARIQRLVRFQQDVMAGGDWAARAAMFGERLRAGEPMIRPFHWPVEFPEVFRRPNPGFDAIVGNPPFLGGKRISNELGFTYNFWLEELCLGASRNADLAAHFFRRAFASLRQDGVFGLIATNTIRQGDTRASGLTAILGESGAILRAVRRYKWPGEAAVVVSIVHVIRGAAPAPVLDERPVRRISAYLVEGDLDVSPAPLAANAGKAFVGSYVLGMGFTFDDAAAAKGEASSLAEMERLIAKDPRNAERVFPYIGGEEVNNEPRHMHHRYAIDFFDRPLGRTSDLRPWLEMDEAERSRCRTTGTVPEDYDGEVAEDWPELLDVVRSRVKPERDGQKRDALRNRWWQYADKRPGLYAAIAPQQRVLVTNAGASTHNLFTLVPTGSVFAHSLIVFNFDCLFALAVLQSRAHELWARFFSSSMKDDLRYAPSDCFRTFPFPEGFLTDAALEAAGEAYHAHRAALMIERNEGLTKTYNRFHDPHERVADIERLRELHAAMDRAVLAAYGWDDLAKVAAPEFQPREDAPDKFRLDWPQAFKDEVLSRLLDLNRTRAAEEKAQGLVAAADDEEDLELAEEDG